MFFVKVKLQSMDWLLGNGLRQGLSTPPSYLLLVCWHTHEHMPKCACTLHSLNSLAYPLSKLSIQ